LTVSVDDVPRIAAAWTGKLLDEIADTAS